jgi:hypothetical protein
LVKWGVMECRHCGREFRTEQALAGHLRAVRQKEKSKRNGKGNGGEEGQILSLAAKGVPVETLVYRMSVPELRDGQQEIYNEGFRNGMMTVLLGIRMAQELSSMAIAQASPLIKMAQEMRQAEGQAAHAAAQEAAASAAERVQQALAPLLSSAQKPDIALAPNPLQGLMARMMERTLSPLLERMIAAFFPVLSSSPSPSPSSSLTSDWPPDTVFKGKEEW